VLSGRREAGVGARRPAALSFSIMYIYSPVDPIYHLARTDNPRERWTRCLQLLVKKPNERRDFGDFELASELPTNRVYTLCVQCALMSGKSG
jgi:hypothetical protein